MKNSTQKLIALAVMGALSVGNIAFVESGIWQLGAGAEVSIADMDAGTYQVEDLHQLKDGRYTVTGSAAGFQSDVKLSVTFDSTGTAIEEVKIISQGETEGIGTKITGSDFTARFIGAVLPIGLAGKEIALGSPSGRTDGESQAETSQAQGAADNVRRDPRTWNPDDQSAQAQSARALYDAGLLSTAVTSQVMKTAYVDMQSEEKAMVILYRAGLSESAVKKLPMADVAANPSPEQQTVLKLYHAGLLASAVSGEEYQAVPADLSVESQAVSRLDKAGLLYRKEVTLTSLGEIGEAASAELDAVSGATISSQAAVAAVNNCYYFLKECILMEDGI